MATKHCDKPPLIMGLSVVPHFFVGFGPDELDHRAADMIANIDEQPEIVRRQQFIDGRGTRFLTGDRVANVSLVCYSETISDPIRKALAMAARKRKLKGLSTPMVVEICRRRNWLTHKLPDAAEESHWAQLTDQLSTQDVELVNCLSTFVSF